MLSIGIVADPVEIKDIVEKLDKDANGLIDFQEFVDFLTPHAKHNKTSLEKHEAMFMQLTKKMEHQSAGFLDINTQLSMERRRFILDAITHAPSQSIADELSDLRYSHTGFSGGASSATSGEQLTHEELTTESRAKRAVARKHKLEALKSRHQVEVRFQALEKIFQRNGTIKVRKGSFCLISMSPTHGTDDLPYGKQNGALTAAPGPSPSTAAPVAADIKPRRSHSKSEVVVPPAATRLPARHHQLQPVAVAQWTNTSGGKRNPIR